MDPRDPKTDRMVAQVTGSVTIADFAPDGTHAVVANYQSVQKSTLYDLDLSTGKLTPITESQGDDRLGRGAVRTGRHLVGHVGQGIGLPAARHAGCEGPLRRHRQFAEMGRRGIRHRQGRQLPRLQRERGGDEPHQGDGPEDARRSRRHRPARGGRRRAEHRALGTIATTVSGATTPGDVFAIDPATLAVTRWTASETGGLDPAIDRAPELVEVKSFDGRTVSGFLYRPDPAKFPGKRPLIVDIAAPRGRSSPAPAAARITT
ncbi:hypothetical protein AB5I41_21510 [Sphingomonas sp. MMS24-JH45]